VTGPFTATPEAARLTRAAHMQGDPVRATVRFSNGGGDPNVPDYAREGRGMSVKLYLDGGTTDMVALSLPCFFVRTPEDFIEFTRVRKEPEKGGEWFAAHPEAQTAIQFSLSAKPPASYATCAYNSIHSYRFVDADGQGRFIRFRWEPEAGEESLEPEEAKARGATYLQDELAEREGAAFRLVVILAEESDAVDDPTVPWPEERERVVVGRLELDGPDTEREQGDDVLVFDPTRVTDGIELSDDQILRFRPRTYAVSVERRSGAPIPAGLA
jgi:catalase